MSRLFINALNISITTDGGLFGRRILFDKGLNIIRAGNSCGKSTCLNAILYALGFEILLGKKGTEGLTPVLRDNVIHGNKTLKVLESYVELELRNNKDEVLTIKRYVTSSHDSRLVLGIRDSGITNPNSQKANYESYYLHSPGSAQNERGFHRYLSDFINWDLPTVSTYKDQDVPLYMECIFPLFFIEQTRGWSRLQATTPTIYQIRNVQRLAVEFVLNLEVSKITKQKQELQNRRTHLKTQWENLGKELKFIAQNYNGIVRNYPDQPVTLVKYLDMPFVALKDGDDWIPIDEYLFRLRDLIAKQKSIVDPVNASDGSQNKQKQITQLQESKELLFAKQVRIDQLQNSLNQEQNTVASLKERGSRLESEIKNNQDLNKLQKYGAEIQSDIASGECPTCHQPVADVLLKQPLRQEYMTIQDTVEFLKQQKEAGDILLKQSEQMLEVRKRELAELDDEIGLLRVKIRDINNELVQATDLPNISQMREIVENEQTLRRLEQMQKQFDEKVTTINDLANEWSIILEEQAKLPKDLFTDTDRVKLNTLRNVFSGSINEFGFSSKFTTGIQISEESYHPIIDGFELASGSSASDNIRLIWAYTLALQETSGHNGGNHIGITFFDEPGQHEIAQESRAAFYTHIGRMDLLNNQIIIATSEDKDTLVNKLKGFLYNLISYEGKVIIPNH